MLKAAKNMRGKLALLYRVTGRPGHRLHIFLNSTYERKTGKLGSFILLVRRPELTQRPRRHRLRQGKRVPSLKVNVTMHQGGKPCDLCSRDGEPFLLYLLE